MFRLREGDCDPGSPTPWQTTTVYGVFQEIENIQGVITTERSHYE
jgi:hypothetical protein